MAIQDKYSHIRKPFKEHLTDVRNELMVMLAEDYDYGATEIAYIFNRTKQLASHVIGKSSSKKFNTKHKSNGRAH